MKAHSTVFLLSLLCLTGVLGWDTEELEIFDLVEEIKTNFYEFMGIGQVGKFNVHRHEHLLISLNFRMRPAKKSRGLSVVFQYSYILTKTLLKMRIFNSEIWFRYTKS